MKAGETDKARDKIYSSLQWIDRNVILLGQEIETLETTLSEALTELERIDTNIRNLPRRSDDSGMYYRVEDVIAVLEQKR